MSIRRNWSKERDSRCARGVDFGLHRSTCFHSFSILMFVVRSFGKDSTITPVFNNKLGSLHLGKTRVLLKIRDIVVEKGCDES